MEFLGERRINPVYGGTYLFCPADTIDEQIQCLKYEPREELWCKHCACGTSDICTALPNK